MPGFRHAHTLQQLRDNNMSEGYIICFSVVICLTRLLYLCCLMLLFIFNTLPGVSTKMTLSVVVVCEHGESPAFRQRHERRSSSKPGREKRQHWHKKVSRGGEKLALRIQEKRCLFPRWKKCGILRKVTQNPKK